MVFRLLESNQHTEIRVTLKKLSVYKKYIDTYIEAYGGRETMRNSKFVYFEIEADIVSSERKD